MFDDEDLLKCPYCLKEQYTHEPDEFDALMCHTECEHCHKTFWYSVDVTREYHSRTEEEEEVILCD